MAAEPAQGLDPTGQRTARPGAKAPVDLVVDWRFAARTAAALTHPGPRLSPAEAAEVVADLRAAALAAHPHVHRVTDLLTRPGEGVLVVDRPGWAKANAEAFRGMLDPVVAESFERRGHSPSTRLAGVGARITGAEVGALLGVLSARVLGQYDAFAAAEGGAPGAGGRLLLVAPTIVSVERELGVDPADFRLWVCLHEETHRVQFTATPWLAEHLLGEIRGLVGGMLADPGQLADRLVATARALPDLLRGRPATDPAPVTPGDRTGIALIDALQSPEQRRRLSAVTAVMSLLEGHADVVMDEVGPEVVPSVATIRQRFSVRRGGRGPFDQLLRKLLGLDAKARQYADGAKFVRAVVAEVGMPGFNRVWESAEHLPTPAEIAEPSLWVRRVHG